MVELGQRRRCRGQIGKEPEEVVDREEVIGEGFLEVRLGTLSHWDSSSRQKNLTEAPAPPPARRRGARLWGGALQGGWREVDGEEPRAREDMFPLAAYGIFVNQKHVSVKKKQSRDFFSQQLVN